jgi:lysophospholipase L1-like esterase
MFPILAVGDDRLYLGVRSGLAGSAEFTENKSMRILRSLPVVAFFVLAAIAVDACANTATEPVPRDEKWLQRHAQFVETAHQGGVDVLFLGDSITDFWRAENPQRGGKAVWEENFAPLHAANFGISADLTQHLLWRIQNGELEGLHPKAIVLLIGTNNAALDKDKKTPRNTGPEIADGVLAVVDTLRKKLPDAKILLLAIFPRATPGDPIRDRVQEANAILAKHADGKRVRFLDIGPKFLEPDGTLSPGVMPDLLHPSEKGYRIWADAIKAPLADLLK